MSSLREQLEVLRKEARDFFAHQRNKTGDFFAARDTVAPHRDDPENIGPKPQIASVMADVADMIRDSHLLRPTALSTHQINTRRMHSALRLKRYEWWDQSVTYDEDIPIASTQAGEEEYNVSIDAAESIFLEALEDTLALLELAQPEKGSTPTITPITGGKWGPKPIEEKVANRMFKRLPPGDWRANVDENGEALDHGLSYPSDPRKLRTQLTALIRRGRTFGHQGTPLTWTEVKRVGTLGCRCLAGLYGEDSVQEANFIYYMDRAFLPWHTSTNEHGRIEKAGLNWLNTDAGNVTGLPAGLPAPALSELRLDDESVPRDRVLRLNKLHLTNALHVLIDAAHRCRSAAPDPVAKPDESAVDPSELPNGNATSGEESQPAERRLKRGGRPRLYVDGERIRKLRGRQSQLAFARFCGISVDALRNAEEGHCSKETIGKIVEKLRRDGKAIKVEDLLKNPPQ